MLLTKPTSPFFVVFCGHSVYIFTLLQQTPHSSPWRSTDCALLAVCHKKKTHTQYTSPSPPHSQLKLSVLPSPSSLVSAPQRCRFINKSEVSLEQCPCFGAQRDTLLLCNNTHILIDCVPDNYSVKREALYQTVTPIGKVLLLETGSYSRSLYLESV